MAIQLDVATRNARLDQVESAVGSSGTLEIRAGAPPANCGASSTGTVLATINLPSDWMASASGGTKQKSGTWSDSAADATGTAAHFRIFQGGTVCCIQGTVGTSAADMIVDSTAFVAGQVFTVISFTLSTANA